MAEFIENIDMFLKGTGETLYMTLLSTLIAYLIGLPLGILLIITDKNGLKPIKWLNVILNAIVNIFRSIPFLILLVLDYSGNKSHRRKKLWH